MHTNKVLPISSAQSVFLHSDHESQLLHAPSNDLILTPITLNTNNNWSDSEDSSSSNEISDIAIEIEMSLSTRLVRITRPFRTRWDLFTMLLAMYNCFTIPFFVAFKPEESVEFFIINTVIDFMFMADIVLNFCTTYVDRNGDEVLDMKRIAKNYLKGVFWLDLIASLPVDNFMRIGGGASDETEIMKLSDLLKLTRILRLGRIIRFTRTRDDIKATLKLFQLTLYLIMWVHLTGCVWFLVIRMDDVWIPVPDFLTGTTMLYQDDIWI